MLLHAVEHNLILCPKEECRFVQQEDHEAFAAKYVLTASLPADSEEECSWPSTCADVITEDDDCRPYVPTVQHSGLCAVPAETQIHPAVLRLRVYRKLREPRLMLHLVDTVQHRIERLKKGHRYSTIQVLYACRLI